jgi:hypothetical protein
MALIGALSLRRAYGTTIRLYTGDFNTARLLRPRPATPDVPSTHAPAARSALLMQRRLPWVSDGASAVAMAGLRSWMRAPELKMMMLSPLIVLVVFTGMFRNRAAHELLRTLWVTGLVAFLMVLGMLGVVGNQFAFDRSGFRALVLSPLPRRDVLLGKNLTVRPYALVATLAVIAASQWFAPIRIDHVAGVLVQALTMYLVLCVTGNLLSIAAPMALKPGSGMPAPNQGIRQVFPLVFMMLIPIPLGLTLIPLGIESLLVFTGWLAWFPAYVVLGAVQAVVAIWVYRVALDWQGRLLHRRERDVLDVVASRVE